MLIRIIDKKTAEHHCQTVFTLFLIIKQLQTASFIYLKESCPLFLYCKDTNNHNI